jgi:two-component system alkaline phosphatase synthesis response regulator PhoP
MASVLVVDDDVDGREIIRQFLSKAGYNVRSAPNGRAALISLLADVPDVVVLDMMMPEMNGVEFLRVIRSYLRWSTLPVIVLTAYPQGPHIDAAKEMGVKHVFTKSNYKLQDLLACVNMLRQNPDADCAAG